MLPNFKVVIADTTCFILLEKIGEIDLLKSVFGNIVTSSIIAAEYGLPLPQWVEIIDAQDKRLQHPL